MAWALGFGSKRRLITLAASALAAVAFAAAVGGRGCTPDDDTPEGAVRALLDAARAGDAETVHELLGPATRDRLAEAARRSTELAGGTKRFTELDLIALGKPSAETTAVSVRSRRVGDQTVVEIEDAVGQRSTLHVVQVDGHWRIEVPAFVGAH